MRIDSNAITSIYGRRNAVTGLLSSAVNSYRRGRDSMGRFTSRDAGYSRRGYSRADGTDRAIERLEDMLKDAGDESEHMAIKKAISVLKNA